ncbi:MAG: hypothetical protein WBG14_06860 [Rhodococcus sp. (in: high G+C Gram-positive bacteria)]|uniref:hypothetical protein n=1 Tax=Nocardiaceae TaxID=85025 RepID=UPI001E52F4EB|nr:MULTISPECIES: hypothetical protein [Rhodococcus]MCZ4275185.1 hypothetical protein [Rhodococcus yunnanensis]
MDTEEITSGVEAGFRPGRPSKDARFTVEQITTGPHASGFGSTDDCRPFSFRVRKSTLYLELYRADLNTAMPDSSDVTAVSEQSVTEIDLTDERSIVAAVRDAVGTAEELGTGSRDSSAVRTLLDRVDSLIKII